MQLDTSRREVCLVVCFVMQVGKIAEEMLVVDIECLIPDFVQEVSIIVQFVSCSYPETHVP